MRAMRADGKSLGEQALDLLRAEPALLQRLAAAPRTRRAQRLLVQAVMADEPLGRAVIA